MGHFFHFEISDAYYVLFSLNRFFGITHAVARVRNCKFKKGKNGLIILKISAKIVRKIKISDLKPGISN